MLLPEPTYKGPESIVYFRGNTLQEELKRDTKVRRSHVRPGFRIQIRIILGV
jgi:hypothetical protein